MTSSKPRRLVVAMLVATGLAACSQPPADVAGIPAPAHSVAHSSVSTPVIAPAPPSAITIGLPGDHASSRHYRIAITLPTLPAGEQALADALRATADNAKRGFLQAMPDTEEMPEFANRRFELQLDFKQVADSVAFTSVRETGMQDTGGAHPIPVEAAFVYDRKAGKLIALDDLFRDADAARKALANFAHDTLLKKFMAGAPKPGEGTPEALREWKANRVQMLDDGTRPTSVNYTAFVIRAGSTENAPSPGISLIFPPYQVAPYVDGTQVVDVPASVFAQFLKPGYAADFESG